MGLACGSSVSSINKTLVILKIKAQFGRFHNPSCTGGVRETNTPLRERLYTVKNSGKESKLGLNDPGNFALIPSGVYVLILKIF